MTGDGSIVTIGRTLFLQATTSYAICTERIRALLCLPQTTSYLPPPSDLCMYYRPVAQSLHPELSDSGRRTSSEFAPRSPSRQLTLAVSHRGLSPISYHDEHPMNILRNSLTPLSNEFALHSSPRQSHFAAWILYYHHVTCRNSLCL